MFFKKFIVAIFISISSLILFICIIRLGNNKKGLLGISDLASYVETVDFSKPLKNFSNSIDTLTTSWSGFFKSIGLINNNDSNYGGSSGRGNPNSNPFNDFFKSLSQAFGAIGNSLKNFYFAFLTTITFPIQLLVDVVILIGNGFSEFYKFINWCITFEGYPAVNLS